MMYQRGTTFFTDGTSGWTQQCAAAMDVAMPPTAPTADAEQEQLDTETYDTPFDTDLDDDVDSLDDTELEE